MVNPLKFVCRDCGKVISVRNKRRHLDRCYPRGPIGARSPGFNTKALFRSVWPRGRLKSTSKY